MEIKVGFEISFAAAQPTPMVIMLSIHPSRHPDIVGRESIVAEPGVPISFYRDSFGNICGRLVAPRGGVTLRGNALVHDSGLPDPVNPAARQLPIDQLPDELLLYLMPSRRSASIINSAKSRQVPDPLCSVSSGCCVPTSCRLR